MAKLSAKSATVKGKSYNITLEKETADDGTESKFYLLKNGSDEKRLSPTTTAEELAFYVDSNQKGYDL